MGGRAHRMADYTIRDMRKKDIPPILVLADRELGRNYIQETTLEDEKGFVLCADVKGNVAGFCTGKIRSSLEVLASFGQRGPCDIPEWEHYADIGWIGSLAVARQYGRQGIGTALMSACLDRLRMKGAELIMMTAWKSSHGIHVGSIAEAQGFTKRGEIPEFWKEDSLNNQYACTECIPPPCRCTAVIYTNP